MTTDNVGDGRDRIAEALPHSSFCPIRVPSLIEDYASCVADRKALADALTPIVRELIADELRAAASDVRYAVPGFIGRIDTADSLDARADVLTAPQQIKDGEA